MISRYGVWLNDVSLTEIHPNIYISDINYQAAGLARSTGRIVALDGLFSGSKDYVDTAKIVVNFVVREYDTRRRQEIVQNVIVWASNGGWLKTADRIGQKIYVKPSHLPAVSSVLNWLDTLTIEFTAYDYPFWQDEVPAEIELSQSATGELWVSGERKAFVEATAVAHENISTMTFTCNGESIVLDSMSVSEGQTVNIRYSDDHHIQQIYKVLNAPINSLMDRRTPESVDDLIANVGNNTFAFAADGVAVCTFSVRGVHF